MGDNLNGRQPQYILSSSMTKFKCLICKILASIMAFDMTANMDYLRVFRKHLLKLIHESLLV